MPDFRPVTPHIWRLNLDWDLRIPFVPPIPVAMWLVKDGSEWTVVDAGVPDSAPAVVDAVARFLGPARPTRLLLTHAHYDHGGALAALVQKWNLPVWAHTLEADFVTGVKKYRDIVSNSWIFNLSKLILPEGNWRAPVGRTLEEGDTASGLDVIHVRGHTPGMIAFHHRGDRAIIAGDAFMNLGGKLSAPLAMSTPEPDEAHRSMKKLAALDFDTLLPSHDPSERGIPAETIRRFVARL